jgi:hypothetical protein
MFCPRCGAENEEGSKYCASCGTELARKKNAGGEAAPENENPAPGARASALLGRDRRTRLVTLGTIAAIVVALVAFLALEVSDNEGADVPQDAYTRALDSSCVQRKGEIAAAQRTALNGGGLAAVSRYADAIVPIAGEWRLELGRGAVPADRSDLVSALQAALLEVQIEAGALARIAREAGPRRVAKAAAGVDAATANVEEAVDSLGLGRCGELSVAAGRLVRQ